jgi:hypothetical protein
LKGRSDKQQRQQQQQQQRRRRWDSLRQHPHLQAEDLVPPATKDLALLAVKDLGTNSSNSSDTSGSSNGNHMT